MHDSLEGVALVERAEGLEDHFEWIGTPLPCFALSEVCIAVVAEPALDDFVPLVAFAGTGDVGAVAV